ncbi:Replication factor C, subunit RFC1 (large subunit) [Pseudoloma neurophilia]|uniref:Replication factor C, subunit RFC1 (Large subunit) n=1 Tax=Pseudoloma neurophilia TaxID=146866 RepID=A0A0R0M365_9MICR|nr:Replication factor C, subunit RFC1 (large subunit) [Pseudoloma neurophilia]
MSNKKIFEKRFVFTGEFNQPREILSNKVLAQGGRVTSAVSGKTDFLVTGEEPGPSKVAKAKDLKINILTEEQFLEMASPVKKNEKETTNNISSVEMSEIEIHKPLGPVEDKRLWTVKYEPTDFDQILGNKTARDQLIAFLSNHKTGRGLLIHGPPGVGKSLSVKLACKKLNRKMIEFNASDVRNKGSLVEKISGFTNTRSLFQQERVLVMDECDGMTDDRGGLAELAQIIKKSRIPIVCICNDKQVVKNLTSCCDEITFRKLETRQILGCIRDIVKKEQSDIKDAKIIECITAANNDMRFTLNSLQGNGKFNKLITTNIFDESITIFKPKKINEKIEMFFKDYDMIPLMIFENYLKCDIADIDKRPISKSKGKKSLDITIDDCSVHKNLFRSTNDLKKSNLLEYAIAAEGFSMSEIFTSISDWSLLPYSGFFSSVLPTRNLRLHKRLDFSKELGFLSKKNKNLRILNQFKFHILSKCNFSQFYFYEFLSIVSNYVEYLVNGDTSDALKILERYNLLKIDLDESIDMLNLMKSIPTKNKTAMTRAYKKIERTLPYNHALE